MDDLIDRTHFKTYDKLKHTLNVPKKQLRETIEKRNHDRHLKYHQKDLI